MGPFLQQITSAMPSLLQDVPHLHLQINAVRQNDPFAAATKLLVDHVLLQEAAGELLAALSVVDEGKIAERFFGARVGESNEVDVCVTVSECFSLTLGDEDGGHWLWRRSLQGVCRLRESRVASFTFLNKRVLLEKTYMM